MRYILAIRGWVQTGQMGNPVGGHPHSRPFPSRERVPDFPSAARNNGYAKVSSGEGDLTPGPCGSGERDVDKESGRLLSRTPCPATYWYATLWTALRALKSGALWRGPSESTASLGPYTPTMVVGAWLIDGEDDASSTLKVTDVSRPFSGSDWGVEGSGLVYVSESLRGEPIGLVQIDERTWSIQFGPLMIGLLDDPTRRVDKTPGKCYLWV